MNDQLAVDDARAQEHPLALTDIEFRGEVIYFIVVDLTGGQATKLKGVSVAYTGG